MPESPEDVDLLKTVDDEIVRHVMKERSGVLLKAFTNFVKETEEETANPRGFLEFWSKLTISGRATYLAKLEGVPRSSEEWKPFYNIARTAFGGDKSSEFIDRQDPSGDILA